MSALSRLRYRLVKDALLPAALALKGGGKKSRPPDPLFGPPLKSTADLRRVMARHYALARHAKGAMPVAWVTSGAPVELLRAFGFYTVYPENHSALCGARKLGPEISAEAEARGYSQDLCSYARVDLGHAFSGKTPVGSLPVPDLLFCANNICQTVLYWFKALSREHGIPLVLLDTPYLHGGRDEASVFAYVEDQLRQAVTDLERFTRKDFDEARFLRVLESSRRAAQLWGGVLETLRRRPAPMTIFDAFVHLMPIVSLRGLPVCERYYEGLLAELRGRVERGVAAVPGERHRLLWDNIAIWFAIGPLARLFAEHGAVPVVATYTHAWAETARQMDLRNPFGALARTYGGIFLNRDLAHRRVFLETLAREYAVDGAVLHSARSCKPYSIGQYDLRQSLREAPGIPSVVLEADMTDHRVWSEAQARTRLEAFFEALEGRGIEGSRDQGSA